MSPRIAVFSLPLGIIGYLTYHSFYFGLAVAAVILAAFAVITIGWAKREIPLNF